MKTGSWQPGVLTACLVMAASVAGCAGGTEESEPAETTASAVETGGGNSAPGDSAAVLDVVERYHAALASADSVGALALLDSGVVVLESGGMETRAEYEAHHLGADMEFSRGVPSVRGPAQVTVLGDAAWVSSTSTTQGSFRDQPINSAGAELMVLRKDAGEWKIAAIHWSSRNVR